MIRFLAFILIPFLGYGVYSLIVKYFNLRVKFSLPWWLAYTLVPPIMTYCIAILAAGKGVSEIENILGPEISLIGVLLALVFGVLNHFNPPDNY